MTGFFLRYSKNLILFYGGKKATSLLIKDFSYAPM